MYSLIGYKGYKSSAPLETHILHCSCDINNVLYTVSVQSKAGGGNPAGPCTNSCLQEITEGQIQNLVQLKEQQ